jgi:hypothetical protein
MVVMALLWWHVHSDILCPEEHNGGLGVHIYSSLCMLSQHHTTALVRTAMQCHFPTVEKNAFPMMMAPFQKNDLAIQLAAVVMGEASLRPQL